MKSRTFDKKFNFNGQSFTCAIQLVRGAIMSPFIEFITDTKYLVRRNDDEIKFSESSADIIKQIGFYGGEGSKYRIDPAKFRRMFFS